MSLYYKFVVAVRQEGRIPQPLTQHLFLSKALVGEHSDGTALIWPAKADQIEEKAQLL
jgi:hypothetical protein